MNEIEGQSSGFKDTKNNSSKRVGAVFLAAGLVIAGVGVGVEAESEIRIDGDMPSQKPDFLPGGNGGGGSEAGEVLSSRVEAPTQAYAERLQKIKKIKEELVSKECKTENLDFCARVLYAVDESPGLYNSAAFPYQEKTILKNYLDRNKVIEFGKTGKGLDVIYFKDEKGKKTNIPALGYVGASDWNVGIKQVQTAIDQWEKDAPGFLQYTYDNDVCLFFQNKASDNPGANAAYTKGILFFNCGLIDKKKSGSSDFVKTIRIHFGVEPFGDRLDELGEKYLSATGAVIKQALAVDCNEYLFEKTGNSFFSDRVKSYQKGYENYLGLSHGDPQKIETLISELKDNKWITPYGAKTWEVIDSVKK